MSVKKPFLFLLLFLLVISMSAWSQTTTGSMRGVVNDAEDKPVPGATVTISSDALIGQTRTTYTNEAGVFRFPSLPVGDYTVEVSMEGFDKVQAQNVEVGLDATANVPMNMRMSTVAESITVQGETPLLDTTEVGFSTSYKNEMLEEVPTQRQMADLIQVAPGMSVDVGDSGSARTIAFGSNRQSSSWNIDGVEVSGPETGAAWWTVNPDVIEEIDVKGVGAPAEYGNHLGAVFNVVTKKGGNDFHGQASYFYQNDALTDTNVELPDSPFVFHREKFRNFASQLGGPIVKDKVWFFGAFQYYRAASTDPGNDPAFAPLSKSDQYDLKVTGLLGKKHELNGFVHQEVFDGPDAPSPFWTTSALSHEGGKNPAWGGGLTSTLTDNMLMELKYAGWWSSDLHDSQTGSFEEPFADYDSPDGQPRYSGGVGPWNGYTWDYETWRDQFNGKMTYYADNFLKSQHEFKFGVQWSKGVAQTNAVSVGPTGSYLYKYGGYLYRGVQDPYQYGGISNDLGFFLDDTVTVNDRLTLNWGVRFDHNTGNIPEYDRLTVGEPSFTPAGKFTKTGETIPGVDVVDWNLVSPRVGFTYQPRADGRSILHASFGVYYDHNVIGNWDAPAPDLPTFRLYSVDPVTLQNIELIDEITSSNTEFDPDLKAPTTLQYAIGFDHQLSNTMAAGVQYVYKDTKDLVGWQILGGTWEQVTGVDPFTGREFTLLSQVENPTLRKSNDPGNFPGSEGLDYAQKYHGVVLTLDKRFSDKWGLNASYTWSRSTGLIPRMLSQQQFNPFYGNKDGADPNNFINADSFLQGDRPHMFRVQAVFFRLPWDLTAATSVELSSGRAHNRQFRFGGLGQGTAIVIMEPAGDPLRFSPIQNVDVQVGKRIYVTEDVAIRLEAWVYNLLNSDQELSFNSLRLQEAGTTFVPDTWVQPRRLQLRVGFQF